MIKKAYAVQMTYEVTDAEKKQAEQALMAFNHAKKDLMSAKDHLDIMKTPFKNNPDVDPKDVIEARAAIRRFRDKALDNFSEFKRKSFRCVELMQIFSSDTQTLKLMKSFVSAINGLEANVNDFADLFSDLEDKDFPKKIVVAMETVQDNCDDIEEIIDERIKNHVQTNILNRTWVDNISNELQTKIEPKAPLILDLFNKRQDQLNETIKERGYLGN